MRTYRTPVRKITHVDILFHEIMRSNISIEEGIAKCVNGKESYELICMLVDCGEQSYLIPVFSDEHRHDCRVEHLVRNNEVR